jgi:hypothetical protein
MITVASAYSRTKGGERVDGFHHKSIEGAW